MRAFQFAAWVCLWIAGLALAAFAGLSPMLSGSSQAMWGRVGLVGIGVVTALAVFIGRGDWKWTERIACAGLGCVGGVVLLLWAWWRLLGFGPPPFPQLWMRVVLAAVPTYSW